LLAAAVAILLAGAHFARREETVRVTADRGPVNLVAGAMERELGRLEQVYENHLRQLALDTMQSYPSTERVWRECDDIVGVVQWSLIHPNPKAVPDAHVVIDPNQGGRMPQPTFVLDTGGMPHAQVLLQADEIFQPNGPQWGWMDEPGKPLLFWQRNDAGGEAVVMLVDRAQLRDALDPWFVQWAYGGQFEAAHMGAFAPLEAAGDRVELLGPDGEIVTANRGSKGDSKMPGLVLPIRSRLGTWQFGLWDRVGIRVHYDTRTQMAAGAFAVLVALVGLLGFTQQRRTLALAARRVSFVNRVSHELRTPLTNILLNLDLAAESLDESASEPARRFALVREEAHRLGRLIENALTFSRKQRGSLKTEAHACVPADVIRAVVEQFAPSFARRALEVRRSGDVADTRLIDADAFAQILSNLLSNVEKYVPGGIVEIASRLESGVLIVTVTDEGPGIAPREAERIFQPFERLDSRINEGASGTGLGLSIARDLATAAGGSLRLVPSAHGIHGASFELRLPAPPAPGISIVSAA
ncbi:MAG TPA: HAMP domain-containing sensor histidine kinase, partial [Chthoniobacteraceae bacterium]|nr:HAMP domain-containing sensor histidine kinase [Chthoniobacteraceae bacterium]